MRPGVRRDHARGVGRVLERIIPRVDLSLDHAVDLAADANHRFAEPVELGERLALRRLDHERARNRERHGRRMEAIIHEPLRHVLGLDAVGLELAQVEDELVGAASVLAGVEDGVVSGELLRHVVGVEDRSFGGELQAIGAHHGDVRPRDGEDGRAAEGRGRHRTRRTLRGEGMSGKKRNEVLGHADRTHTGTAAAVRNAEGLVEVDVADVGAHVGRPGETDLCVHVGAVHIHLAATLMDDLADPLHVLFEDAVSGRIRDHQCGQPILVVVRLLLEVGQIHVAPVVAGNHDHLEADHHRGGGIRAVRRNRDETDIATAAPRGMVATNGEQPRVFALGAGVRLQRNARETGDLGQPVGEILREAQVPLRLALGSERVDVREAGKGERQHLGSRVELHRARPERNHRMRE